MSGALEIERLRALASAVRDWLQYVGEERVYRKRAEQAQTWMESTYCCQARSEAETARLTSEIEMQKLVRALDDADEA